MPLEFLHEIARSSIPMIVHQESDIDKVRVLVAAELIDAALPAGGHEGQAVVRGITALGRAWLKARPAGPGAD